MTSTYSFLDVKASITGPGGAFSLGSGAGVAEEGISIEPSEDINTMTIGADGSGRMDPWSNARVSIPSVLQLFR